MPCWCTETAAVLILPVYTVRGGHSHIQYTHRLSLEGRRKKYRTWSQDQVPARAAIEGQDINLGVSLCCKFTVLFTQSYTHSSRER